MEVVGSEPTRRTKCSEVVINIYEKGKQIAVVMADTLVECIENKKVKKKDKWAFRRKNND